MSTPTLHSAKQIEQQFHTGEEPVMVMCSDVNIYVCKYMRSSATAYKLACEFIGAKLAKAWQMKANYEDCLQRSKSVIAEVLTEMPQEWKVPSETVSEKMHQLFDAQWIARVWENFTDCLNENIG